MQVTTVVQSYLTVFPQEEADLQPLLDQLQREGEVSVTSRSTFSTGHVTAGVIIVSLPAQEVLMIDHAALGKRLQPGGHVELSDDSILEAAYRECEEEVGLTRDVLTYIPLSEQAVEVPFNIMVQDIPAHVGKGEPVHQHYDFWYLFTVAAETPLQDTGDEGIAGRQWMPMEDFAALPEFARPAEKVQKMLL
jgi:8-oxo-dGTP pyrophosphatase MutT (NUDIX family)